MITFADDKLNFTQNLEFVFHMLENVVGQAENESKLKSFADDKLNFTQKLMFVFHRLENFAGKEENAGYQHFLLLPQRFQKTLFPSHERQKSTLCCKGLTFYQGTNKLIFSPNWRLFTKDP